MHVEALEAVAAQEAAPEGRLAYYLRDFNSVIAGVLRLYANLLTDREHEYIGKLAKCSLPAQSLYARLANRKGPCFRVAKLDYPEIGALDLPIAELAACGLLEICSTAPAPSRHARLLACFTLPELRAALTGHNAPKAGGRAGLLAWLASWEHFQSWIAGICSAERIVGLPETDPWRFITFLFFGELRDNLSDFVTRALGHVVTESFDAPLLQPRFTSRAQADDAYRMARLYRSFGEIRDTRPAPELLEWWRGHGIERHHLQDGHAWFDRLVDRLGRRLERAQLPEAALALYATSPVAPARERQARLLLKAGRQTEAIALLQAMAAAPCHPEEAYAARQLLARLARKTRRSESRQFQQTSRSITLHYAPRSTTDPGMTVEAAVLAHYRAQGWQGVHSENWLWNASFGLLLWDTIYDPRLGVFHAPLQFAPSDLYLPAFYERRQEAIEARLRLLRQPEQAYRIVAEHFAAKQGLANPFVAWHEDLPEILHILLHRVPPEGHAAVLRHMARNLRHHARGFVDLFLWNDRDYRFIEIKGENDHLAAHQFEWLRFFAKAGIKVSLEKVQRPGP